MKPINHLICLAFIGGGLFASLPGLASGNPAGTNSPTATAKDFPTISNAAPANATAANSPTAPADAPKAEVSSKVPQPPSGTEPAAAQTAQPPAPVATAAQSAPAPAQDSDTNSVADFPADKGLRMNFRGAPLEMVLNYMSKAAGFVINVTRSVDVKGKVDIWSAQPLTKEEAVELLKKILNQNGYTVMQDKRILTIISNSSAKNNDGTPVEEVVDFRTIPKDTTIVTEVIPVRSLNPGQLLKDLQPLLPSDTTVVANENANSIVMTDTHANIRHLAEIVSTLDSVSSGVNSLNVFHLQYADAKTVADLIKELFSGQDASSKNTGGGFRFGRFGGGSGMFTGGGPPEPGSSSSQAPTTHVGAVADDHSNSVIVSAPDNLMALISNLVSQIDIPVQAVTMIKVFKLKHADAVETAELLNNLFPDESSTSDAAKQSQSGSRGGFFSAMLAASRGGGGNNGGSSEESNRLKLMGRVNAQPEPRTGSVVVTAAKDLMPEIETMIKELDDNPAKVVKAHVISLVNADPYDVQTILSDVIAPNPTIRSTSANNTTLNNTLLNRANTIQQQQNTSQATSTSGFGTMPR